MKLTNEERFFLYEEWGRRCYLGGEPLASFAAMEADHIIPRTIALDQLQSLLRDLGLPESFDLDALENRLPSCGQHNREKSDWVVSPITMGIELAKATKAAERIRSGVNGFRADRDAEANKHKLSLMSREPDAPSGADIQRLTDDWRSLNEEVPVKGEFVTFDVVEYENFSSGIATRRVWLLNPPGKQSVAVVIESNTDKGTAIQNAAERIASAVIEKFPGHCTVLHYDDSVGKAWENFWMPIPFIDGEASFGESLQDFPNIAETLRACGLI